VSEFFTGYDPTLERRDELQSTATPVSFTVRDYEALDEMDFRKYVRHDKQGNMGSCGGFGNTNGGECLWGLAHGGWSDARQFSALFSYLEAQRLDGLLGRDAGSTISSGLKISKELGYLLESELPYQTPYPGNARTLITNEMRSKAGEMKIRSHAWLENYDGMKNYMASQAGVCFAGTPWNDSFYGRNGVVESVNFTRFDGGHAYLFAGYSKRKDSRGRNYIWRLNSHNDSWTEIAPSVIDALCKHQYTSIVGISDLSLPGPRSVSWLTSRPLG
jgi:hypothetical protein